MRGYLCRGPRVFEAGGDLCSKRRAVDLRRNTNWNGRPDAVCLEQWGAADIMTWQKVGGGVPIGACLATDSVAKAFTPGSQLDIRWQSTAVLRAWPSVAPCWKATYATMRARWESFGEGLSACKERHRVVERCGASGSCRGLSSYGWPSRRDECLARGILINSTGEHVLRFVPPHHHPAGNRSIARYLAQIFDIQAA